MGKKCEGGSVKVGIFGNDKWNHFQKKHHLTDTPFIVKFRFEKYRYLLTYLLCIQIFEALLSDSHSTGPQKEDTTITKRRTTSAFDCLV